LQSSLRQWPAFEKKTAIPQIKTNGICFAICLAMKTETAYPTGSSLFRRTRRFIAMISQWILSAPNVNIRSIGLARNNEPAGPTVRSRGSNVAFPYSAERPMLLMVVDEEIEVPNTPAIAKQIAFAHGELSPSVVFINQVPGECVEIVRSEMPVSKAIRMLANGPVVESRKLAEQSSEAPCELSSL
jgi:hypothetical protein